MDGEILTGSGWQKICTDFHRKHPEIEKECIESDTTIRRELDKLLPSVRNLECHKREKRGFFWKMA